MNSREDIIKTTTKVLSRMILDEPEDIELEDRLNEDLGLDSMDAVDLVVDLKSELGVKFGEEDIKRVQTVQDIVSTACEKMDDKT